MSLDIIWTTQFKKDYKKALKRGLDIDLLDNVIKQLSNGKTLEPKYRDHDLRGNWLGYKECHIAPDWLLVYKIDNGILTLVLSRTGSHGDLF